jgi:hypothetical protein
MYELFGNAKWARELGSGEIAHRARDNIGPALPVWINVRSGELIHRCWNSDPDEGPTIEEVLQEIASMRFRFVSDIDCESVMSRALTVGPSDLIRPPADFIPEPVETSPPPSATASDALQLSEVISLFTAYFESLHLSSE